MKMYALLDAPPIYTYLAQPKKRPWLPNLHNTSGTKVDTLTYFSSAAIAFAFKTCQIFAIGAFVIWWIFSM